MVLSNPESWTSFNKVNVDLSDVVGTPGLPEAPELAERLAHGFRAELVQLADVSKPFISGSFPQTLPSDPEKAVRKFVSKVDASLPEESGLADSVTFVKELASSTGRHVVAQQVLRGTEVVGARFRLHLTLDNQPYAFTGQPKGDLQDRDPGKKEGLSQLEAMHWAQDHFDLPPRTRVTARRVIFPVAGRGLWAWQTKFTAGSPPADVLAYVQADNAQLLLSYTVTSTALRGEGHAFEVNPLRSPSHVRVRLDHIDPNPGDRLTGDVVEVLNGSGRPSIHPRRDCRCDPSNPAFDEVNVYYHLCNGLHYFRRLIDDGLLRNSPFNPVRAIVNDPSYPNDAAYSPYRERLYFGLSDDGRSPGRSADIIYHELTHAVSDAICRLGRNTQDSEARGLNEGYSDYFACSALDHPAFGDYLRDEVDGARNCASQKRFAAKYEGEEHATGEVWASVLWSIRKSCGSTVADVLAAESLQFLEGVPTFEDGLASLLQADQDLFPAGGKGGRHEDEINDAFNQRRPAQES